MSRPSSFVVDPEQLLLPFPDPGHLFVCWDMAAFADAYAPRPVVERQLVAGLDGEQVYRMTIHAVSAESEEVGLDD